jgi:ABC-type iron transport system FetAB ATPase subunit
MSRLALEAIACLALDPVVLEVAAGECVAVHGPSGSGKTLLLRAVADLDPHQGTARVDGEGQADMPGPLWRRRVGLLPAESAWWSERVGDHFPGRSADSLDPLGLDRACLDWSVSRLSSGERQRLALARLLAAGPEVLLLDEPTANLDGTGTARVEALVARYRSDHRAAVLWVSHDPEQRRRVADRRFRIRGRGLVEEDLWM